MNMRRRATSGALPAMSGPGGPRTGKTLDRYGRSRLRDGAVDLPGRGGDVGLEAEAAHDLLEGRVVAPGGDGLRGHRHLGRVGDVLAVKAAQAEARMGERLQQ